MQKQPTSKPFDLRDWRKAQGLSREKLGVRVGLSSYTLWKAETGKPVGRGTAAILAQATGWPMATWRILGDI